MKLLKSVDHVELLWDAVDKCKGLVELRSADGREVLNLKSVLSRYVAVGELLKDHGDEYEIFCANRSDEGIMMQFFTDLQR